MHIGTTIFIGIQLGGRGRSPLPLFENQKCLGFGKKGPDCVHLCVEFSIQNANSRVFRWKNSKMFPCLQGLFSFFLFFWQNVYCSVLVPRNLPCPEKFVIAHLPSGTILFAKHSILIAWQCSEYVSASITMQ